MANPTQREGPSSASLKEPVARNFADPAKAVYLDGPGCLAVLQCLFENMLQFKCCHFFKPRNEQLPPRHLNQTLDRRIIFIFVFSKFITTKKTSSPFQGWPFNVSVFAAKASNVAAASAHSGPIPPTRNLPSPSLRQGKPGKGWNTTSPNWMPNNKYCSWRLFFFKLERGVVSELW